MDANGMTAVDSTGVQRGNEGIDIGVWTPPGEPERAPLPIYPQPSDLWGS